MLKVKIDKKAIDKIQKQIVALKHPVDGLTAAQIGSEVIKGMIAFILKGISPIFGKSKFPAYKDRKKYPLGNAKAKEVGKTATPVNLKLSGEFLKALSATISRGQNGYKTDIFYEGKFDLYEQGHREGANTQPKRPTIPQGGEKFNASIMKTILRIYKDMIRRIVSR